MGIRSSSNPAPGAFPNTRWSIVLAACRPTPDSATALEAICRDYWYPLYAYVRRAGHSPHDAQDLTQAFFCRLLDKRLLEELRPAILHIIRNSMDHGIESPQDRLAAGKPRAGTIRITVRLRMA